MAEKRRGHRIRVNLRARYQSDAAAIEGWVANLSRHGMFIRSDYLDNHGARVRIDLTIPGHEDPLELDGEVVRVETSPLSSGMGIRFSGMAAPIRRALANFMIERSYQALQ